MTIGQRIRFRITNAFQNCISEFCYRILCDKKHGSKSEKQAISYRQAVSFRLARYSVVRYRVEYRIDILSIDQKYRHQQH